MYLHKFYLNLTKKGFGSTAKGEHEMKKILATVLATAMTASMLTGCGSSEKPAAEQKQGTEAVKQEAAEAGSEKVEERYLTLSAVASSSGLFPYCVALGEVLSNLPELEITVAESGGNVANTQELRVGEVSIANSISNTDYESYTGTGTTFEGDPFQDVRILWYYESTPIQVFVAADSGIDSLAGLDGQTFNPGGTGTAAAVVMHAALDALDIHPNYFEAAQADAGDAYANRQIVGSVKTGSAPDSYIVQANTNRAVKLINYSEDELATVLEAIPSVTTGTVPANSYDGVDYDVETLCTYQGIQVDMSFSQELVYKMWKAMWEDYADTWKTAYTNGANNNVPEMTLQAAKTPLHAGTVQYLTELGYEVPENLIPEEYVPVQ